MPHEEDDEEDLGEAHDRRVELGVRRDLLDHLRELTQAEHLQQPEEARRRRVVSEEVPVAQGQAREEIEEEGAAEVDGGDDLRLHRDDAVDLHAGAEGEDDVDELDHVDQQIDRKPRGAARRLKVADERELQRREDRGEDHQHRHHAEPAEAPRAVG